VSSDIGRLSLDLTSDASRSYPITRRRIVVRFLFGLSRDGALGLAVRALPLSPCGRGWRAPSIARCEPGEGFSLHQECKLPLSRSSPSARTTLSHKGRGKRACGSRTYRDSA